MRKAAEIKLCSIAIYHKLTLAEYNARFSKLKGTCKKYTIVGLYSWKKNESSCNDKDVQSTWGQVINANCTAKLPTM